MAVDYPLALSQNFVVSWLCLMINTTLHFCDAERESGDPVHLQHKFFSCLLFYCEHFQLYVRVINLGHHFVIGWALLVCDNTMNFR